MSEKTTAERFAALRDDLLWNAERGAEATQDGHHVHEDLLPVAALVSAAAAAHQAFLSSVDRCECGRVLPNGDSSVRLCGLCTEVDEPEALP